MRPAFQFSVEAELISGSVTDIQKLEEFQAGRERRSPFYTRRSHLPEQGHPEDACPSMVDGPLYLQEQVQRTIDQVSKARADRGGI
jgi:hypothetical protein